MTTKQPSAQAAESTPRFDVFVVEKYKDQNGNEQKQWTRIGVAFPHGDGQGFNILCVAWPVVGDLVVRQHEPRPDNAEYLA